MRNTPKKAEPMDDTTRERAVGVASTNTKRVCWAAKTLVAEVNEAFPETPVEYSNYDGRNTALDVAFDLTVLDSQDRADMIAALTLFDFDADERISAVDAEDGQVFVSFRSSARTQDSREPFGLLDALSVLSGREEWDYGTETPDDAPEAAEGSS